jgi:hypothetical protein
MGSSEKHSKRQERHRDINKNDEQNQKDRKKRSREHDDDRNDRRKRDRGKRSRRYRDYSDEEEDRSKRRKRDHKKKRHSKHEEDSDVDSSSSVKKRHRKNDRKKEEKKRSKKETKRSKKESTNIEAKSKIDKSKLFPLGNPLGHPPSKLLDPESDYFAYHKHLWLYLYRECGTTFNDLTSSEQARSAFADFCSMYNAGSLEAGYYSEQLPSAALEECKTSSHRWKIQISDREDKNLQLLQEGVHKQTEYQTSKLVEHRSEMRSDPSSTSYSKETKGIERQQESNPEERRRAERIANRRLREHIRTTEEELLEESGAGKKHGRERLLEKRKELAGRIHGAARDREEASHWELDDDGIYGDRERKGLDRALEVSKRENARRRERQQERVAELERREKEKQAAMLEILGLKDKIQAGKKIEIAPRKDE